jgi:hypothetical protein
VGGLKAIKNMINYILMYINFIESFSFNYYIKINSDFELWIPKFYHENSKVFACVYDSQRCHHDFNLLRTMIFIMYHFFGWIVVHP